MPKRRMPVRRVVAAVLVTVITLLLGAFGVVRYIAVRD